ncbi:MAG: bifunctional (p)ppGpp synthetase/guanosine-3',5'-bis(diphosphate) 3'-pyrophosphohydrolase [Deltaproteobacteria bacterium]|nr:bifunctional (p)ppGpp synthetase/guanosine-3',5'-bis(diphosphate) 3'-pyrophosphohydrolase [Deltaproteobacteria bacterium]
MLTTRLDDILEKVSSYNPSADLEVIKKAYVFSGVVHQGQSRMSGEPYLIHPIEVAFLLADFKMDPACVATGLLHDTVEDTYTTIEKIQEMFGPEIAALVDGVTKISRMSFEKAESAREGGGAQGSRQYQQAENFRKMILAMSRDIRVIIIKLADRLHNMRTLGHLDPVKRKKIALETLEIYAPLANRLGIGWIKTELENLSFKYLEPEKYEVLMDRVGREMEAWKDYIEKARAVIEQKLKENNLQGDVGGRIKHLYSIHKKMVEQDVDIENIHDIIAFRVVVKSVMDCYAVLGMVHNTWKPVPGRFKDFIALPKLNMYQSLHTTVIGPFGARMEVQIRTEEMHRVAEYGIAAHWKYKEGKDVGHKDDKSFAWLRQLLEWQRDLKESDEFLESLKVGLFPEEVFVFTPKGDIKQFPAGSTPVDFAYGIHTDIGNKCSGARLNGRMVPLKTRFKNGDTVEIITAASHHPSKDWLAFVATPRARTRIRQWIKTEEREQSIVLGKEILEREFAKHGLEFTRMVKTGEMENMAKGAFSLAGMDSLFASVGYGKISVAKILGKILPPEKLADKAAQKFSFRNVLDRLKPGGKPSMPPAAVIVRGEDDVLVKFARCCNPLPGDEIAGFLTHGQGVAVHAAGCQNLLNIDRERRVDVAWDKKTKATRPVRIEVVSRNEKGILADMTNAIKAADANISSAEIKTSPENKAICTFEVEVNNLAHLKTIMHSLQKIKKVLKVERVKRTAREGEHEGTL